jgi:hypothetical protein
MAFDPKVLNDLGARLAADYVMAGLPHPENAICRSVVASTSPDGPHGVVRTLQRRGLVDMPLFSQPTRLVWRKRRWA